MDLEFKQEKRTEQVLARFTVKEMESIRDLADKYDVSLSETVRTLAMAAIKEIK